MLLVHARNRMFSEKGCFAISCNQAERRLSISGNLATICGAAIERCGFPERNRTCLHTTSAYSSKGASFGFLQAMRFSRTRLAKLGFPGSEELPYITGYKTDFDMNQYFFLQGFQFSEFSLHKWIGLYAIIFPTGRQINEGIHPFRRRFPQSSVCPVMKFVTHYDI